MDNLSCQGLVQDPENYELRIDFAGDSSRSSLSFVPPLMAIVRLASQVYPEVLVVIQMVTHRRLHWSLRFLAEFLLRLLLVFDIYFGYS